MSGLANIGLGDQHMGWYQFSGAELSGGTTAPTMTVVSNFRAPHYTIGDDSKVHFRVPRTWHTESLRGMSIIVSWGINRAFATESATVQWRVIWEAVPTDMTVALAAASTTVDSGNINIPATANTIRENTLTTIAAASIASNDVIGLSIFRIAAGVAPGGGVEPYILSVKIGFPVVFPAYEL